MDPEPVTEFANRLRARIERDGPMTVEQWMAVCLADPDYGYYRHASPLGRGGDFTTAPEISQMFGELIGLWSAVVWAQMGAPDPVRFIEFGPGRGTLMSDALRALNGAPEMQSALHVDLVEISPVFRDAQQTALANVDIPVNWHVDVDDVPSGPCIIIANEFLDALPVRQWVCQDGAWRERMVAWSDGAFVFIPGPIVDPAEVPPKFRAADEGAIFETSPVVEHAVATISRRVVDGPGAALIIDYGHLERGVGETLQAVRQHAFADPLANPGQCDLTAHIDFARIAEVARAEGARVWGGIAQGTLLERLGLGTRTAALLTNATHAQAADIATARDRLVSPDGMGQLFKAIALTGPDQPAPPGFEEVSLG